MAKKEAIRKKVLSCFFIMMILMSVMPTSIFASANSNITSNGLSTTQSTPQSNAESLKGGLHILSSDLTLTSSDLTLTRADYDMGIAVEDVSKIGRYTEATAEGKKLLYGYPAAGTSYTTIQIDGNDYCQNDTMDLYVTQRPTIIEDSVVTKWTLPPDVKVSQDLTLMQNTTRNRLTVTNNDHASHRVKIRYMFDTMLADVDGAPFRVPGVGDITTEREFINPVFDYWRAMDSLANPTLTSDCVFVPYNKPYKVQFAYWPDIKRVPFDYTITAGQSITGDTAVGMYWDLGTLVSGEIKEVIVYYGTAQPPPPEIQIMIMNLFTEFDNYLSSQAVSGYTYIGNRGNVPFVDGQLAITITNPRDEQVFETSSHITLNPDQTISPGFTYNLPVDAVGGVYTINATIYDAEHNVLDQSEAAFSVTAIDLSISPENIVTSIGGSAEYAITITNPSDIAVLLNLSLTGLDGSWYMLGKESLILNAGEEETVILNVTIPESPDNVGEYSFNVFAGAKSVSAVLNVGLEPIIYELSPPNDVIMSSNDVIFSWKTSVNSTTELYIKQETEADFTQVSGDRGLEHSVTVGELTRNTNYIWHIRSCTAFGCAVSEDRAFYIDNGIVFTQDIYEFRVERDYDQHCFASVKNMDSVAHDLLVRTSNPYDDLYFGFIGAGSADWTISLADGETKDIALVIHAQDAMQEDYTFTVNLTNLGAENITDYALVHVHVRHPDINFTITEVSTDPITLSKTIRVTNRGDPVTDLSLTPDEKLKGDVIIQPSLAHCSLGTGESVDIVISPIWSEGIRYIHGTVTATVADESKELFVDYSCPEGKEMYPITLDNPILYFNLKGAWCINCHHVEDIFNLPPGFGKENVVYAYIGMELNAGSGQTRPYNVYIGINGHRVGTLSNTFPRGYYEFDIDSSYLNYATAGTAENRYTLDTDMPGSYMTPLSNVRVVMCVDELKLHICAESAEQAEEIAWSAPYIHKPSGSITVNVLAPEEGRPLNLNQPVLIKAEVLGDDGKEKRCTVKATFSCCDDEIALVDNGLHDDGQADDGVYANTWIPGIAGSCEITVSASDCAASNREFRKIFVGEQIDCYYDGIVALVRLCGWTGELSVYMNDQEKTVPVMQEQIKEAVIDKLFRELCTPFSTMWEASTNYQKTKEFIDNAPKLEFSEEESYCINRILLNAKHKRDYLNIIRDGKHVQITSKYFQTVIDQPNVVFDRITIDGTKDPMLVEVVIDGVTLQVKVEVYPGFIDIFQDAQRNSIEFDLDGYHYTPSTHSLRIGVCSNIYGSNHYPYFSWKNTFNAPFLDTLGIKNHITVSIDTPTYYKKAAFIGGAAAGLSASAHPGVGGSGGIKLAIYEKIPFPVFLENADEIQRKLEKRKLDTEEGKPIQEIASDYISECLQNAITSQDDVIGIAITESLGLGAGGAISGVGVYMDIVASEGSAIETPLYTFLNEEEFNKCLAVLMNFVSCKAALMQSCGNLLSPSVMLTYANLINSINQVPPDVQKNTLLKSYVQVGPKFGGSLIVGGSDSAAGRLEVRKNLVLLPTEEFYLNFRSRLVGKLAGGLYMPIAPGVKFVAEIFLGASMPGFIDIEDPFDQFTASSNNLNFLYLRSDVLDTDDNGLFDYLNVSYNLETNISGDYMVVGALIENKSVIVTELLNTTLNQGNNTVQVSFTGFRLRYTEADGPYEVGCMIFDENLSLVTTNFTLGVTDAYSYLDFEAPSANITGVNFSAVDEDFDGLYDYMDCNLTIYSEEKQNLFIDSVFGTSENTYYGDLVGAAVDAGFNSIHVKMNDSVLRALCGNISTSFTCIDENKYTLSELYTNTQYFSRDFQSQEPILEDYINTTFVNGSPALELKVNSLHDENISIMAYYSVNKTSFATSGFYNIGPGVSEIILPLDQTLLLLGPDIECNITAVKLYSESGLIDSLRDIESLMFYIVPKATILYKEDSTVDIDKDGKYDILRINLTINSTESGNFLLASSLTGNGAVTQLDILTLRANSPQNVVIEFEGALISELRGYIGRITYQGLLYKNRSLWARVNNVTGFYSTSDFSRYPVTIIPAILFDESHGEIFSTASTAKYSYSKLASLLEPKGYEVTTLNSTPITSEKLDDCSIFVISAPKKPFDTNEVIAIREFVSNGGSLLLLNEWGGDFRQGSNLNEIAENFGIVFKNDLVNDPTDNFHSTPSYAIIHEFSRHSITKGINEYLYPAGCSLIANNFSIARADDDSYTTLPKIPIQALAEEEPGAITVLAATNFEGGRVVCIGDGDFCGDLDIDGDGRANIDEYDNKKLALNIVEWLARAAIVEPPVASFTYSPPKSFTNQTITFDASSSYDPDGTITKYEWDFGDGRTGTGKTITHTYSSAGNYTASLTVTDKDVATGTSSKVITVDPQTSIRTPIQTSIQLQTGWNLISLPIMPDDTDVLDVMNPVDGNWNSVWSYEAGNWKGYDFTGPSFLNDLTIMEPRKGYWIDMKSDDTLYVSGSEPTVKSISLTSGWNLVGYNSLNSMPTMSAMNSVAGNWNSVWSYEAGNWEGYDLAGPSFLNDLTTMEPGKGYWIDMKSSDTWTLGA